FLSIDNLAGVDEAALWTWWDGFGTQGPDLSSLLGDAAKRNGALDLFRAFLRLQQGTPVRLANFCARWLEVRNQETVDPEVARYLGGGGFPLDLLELPDAVPLPGKPTMAKLYASALLALDAHMWEFLDDVRRIRPVYWDDLTKEGADEVYSLTEEWNPVVAD